MGPAYATHTTMSERLGAELIGPPAVPHVYFHLILRAVFRRDGATEFRISFGALAEQFVKRWLIGKSGFLKVLAGLERLKCSERTLAELTVDHALVKAELGQRALRPLHDDLVNNDRIVPRFRLDRFRRVAQTARCQLDDHGLDSVDESRLGILFAEVGQQGGEQFDSLPGRDIDRVLGEAVVAGEIASDPADIEIIFL